MRTSSRKQMPPRMKFFVSRIFPLIFVVVGGACAFFGLRGLVRAKASVDWPATEGTVAESSVERKRSTGSRRGSSTTYHARVRYKFSVDGTVYSGDRVAYGDYGSSNSSHANGVVKRYPEGKQVTVHYMPGNPEECLLETGAKAQAWFLPLFGLVFFTVGILMAVFIPKGLRQQEAARQTSVLGSEQSEFGSE